MCTPVEIICSQTPCANGGHVVNDCIKVGHKKQYSFFGRRTSRGPTLKQNILCLNLSATKPEVLILNTLQVKPLQSPTLRGPSTTSTTDYVAGVARTWSIPRSTLTCSRWMSLTATCDPDGTCFARKMEEMFWKPRPETAGGRRQR